MAEDSRVVTGECECPECGHEFKPRRPIRITTRDGSKYLVDCPKCNHSWQTSSLKRSNGTTATRPDYPKAKICNTFERHIQDIDVATWYVPSDIEEVLGGETEEEDINEGTE